MLSEVEVRRCRRLKSDAVGGPMLSATLSETQKVHLSASIPFTCHTSSYMYACAGIHPAQLMYTLLEDILKV